MTNNLTDTIRKSIGEDLKAEYIEWRNGPGTMAVLSENADWWLSHIKSTQLALLKAVEEEVGKMERQRLEGVLPEFKATEIYNKGFNQAYDDLLSLLRQAREELTKE